ncbi:Cytochrome P450 monooxygenase aba1 [Fulvia fulva]|uniref:Cytochrome P450 monooxygenase aba1 n=1 Tax=Passalora fulva TaxID=5499 RepID=A0A9Q8PK60_PASFU|nr:Cytochrome P450 monooxygenase aba1 [Fulvia fulva]KAK4611599.1 Cytochrome P450 monooxygenase aba1 [Fulvia fulva]KAK4613082.1 Cytochrome P450 monooxygenase aba1 [Fulvia fulva]UJO23869.1 Cytochrome P450 monooxygenase aba1 [Fulvia fulva]WPV21303.1 Cytochrome P450 monooxygenase aba1 [Fulvia fulva]WPV35951.1 Cytochrome P450 monooxygenase aba1 [Fulvia fulva]
MCAFLTSEEYFGPDADTFSPERFMVLEEDERKRMERNVELAFGSGQWMCVGKTIAFMELFKSVFEEREMGGDCADREILSYGVFLETNLMVIG